MSRRYVPKNKRQENNKENGYHRASHTNADNNNRSSRSHPHQQQSNSGSITKTSSKINYNLLLESNIKNLAENLKSDYLHSVDLLFEYFHHKNNISNVDVMKIVHDLCHNLPISEIVNETRYIDQFCRFISFLCIQYNIDWKQESLNLFLSVLIKDILSNEDMLLSLTSYLPNILRTIGHVLFERGNLINEENHNLLIALLIPLSCPKYHSKVQPESLQIQSIDRNVDKLCIYYGKKKFAHSQHIESYQTSKQIHLYIQECNKKNIAINQKIKEVWKYYINVRKFSLIALAHCIIKSNQIFLTYKSLISKTMFVTFHFLKSEYQNYVNNKLCRNQHDFAKSITPIIRSLSQLFNEFDFDDDSNSEHHIDDDLVMQIVEDLKDLMTLGANSSDDAQQQQQQQQHSIQTTDSESYDDDKQNLRNPQKTKPLYTDYTDFSKKERHRYRNRVLLDWNGEQYRHANGYTSDSVLGSAENEMTVDKSFFVPFDIFSKLRMYVQHCMGLLVKKSNNNNSSSNSNNNYFNNFWNKLLPKDVTSALSPRPFYGSNIFTVLLYDPHPRVRNAASITLYNLLEVCASKITNLLSSSSSNANSNNNKLNNSSISITTISDRANETLLAMHRGLIFAIEHKEIHTTPRTQILKCLILLITITDYNRLEATKEENILIKLVSITFKDINSSTGLYKSAVLTLLSSIFSVNYNFHKDDKAGGEEEKFDNILNDIMPMLLQEIKKCNGPNPCCDPRSILIALSKNYRQCLSCWWNKGLKDVIHGGFTSNQHYTIVLETIRLINTWIVVIPISRISAFNDYNDCVYGFFKLENAGKHLGFWLTQLIHTLNVKQSPDSAAIKSKICILISSLKSWHFNLFDTDTQCLLLEFVSDCLDDVSYPSVRGCACKAAGNMCTIYLNENERVLKYYPVLLSNLLNLLSLSSSSSPQKAKGGGSKNRKQQYLLVSKSSCAVANVCNYNTNQNKLSVKQLFIYNSSTNANDMMLKEFGVNQQQDEHAQPDGDEQKDDDEKQPQPQSQTHKYKYPETKKRLALTSLIDNKLLISMINALLAICKENKHNISYNSIRAIGNISFWIDISKPEFASLWPSMCNAIGYCLSTDKKLKNQWNACFAAGNALSNASIPLLFDKDAIVATRDLYTSVLTLLDQCENYKVKITAVYALSCPASRKNYGPIYYKLLKRISAALNNIDELAVNGFAKQKYKQLLKFRLIKLLSHLIKLGDEKKNDKVRACVQVNDTNIFDVLFPNT